MGMMNEPIKKVENPRSSANKAAPSCNLTETDDGDFPHQSSFQRRKVKAQNEMPAYNYLPLALTQPDSLVEPRSRFALSRAHV